MYEQIYFLREVRRLLEATRRFNLPCGSIIALDEEGEKIIDTRVEIIPLAAWLLNDKPF